MLGLGKLRRLRRSGDDESVGGLGLLSARVAATDRVSRNSQSISHESVPAHGQAVVRGGALSRQALLPITEFITLEPQIDRAPLRPPTFTNVKVPDTAALFNLTSHLSPIRLFEANGIQEQATATTEPVETLPEPALPEPVQLPSGLPQRDPLWFSLAASKTTDARAMEQDLAGAIDDLRPQLEPLEFADAVDELESEQPDRMPDFRIDDDSIYDSPMPYREYGPRRRSRPWHAIEAFFLSRGFSQAVAACVIALFVSTLDVPWRNWFDSQVQRVKDPIVSVADNLSRPIKERSAFFIVDDFSQGLDHWLNSRSLELTDAGYVAVHRGLSLHADTMNLESYRFDFEAKIESDAVGWVVRAADTNNYYAFKLVEKGGRSDAFDLLRYTVVDGARDAVQGIARVAVPENLTAAADFNRISVRVRGNQLTTLINGWGVDFWQDDRLDRGGVGLLADRGESALVRKMSVAGNEDTWGLILYGTLETIRSVQNTFSAPVALRLEPGPAPNNAAMLMTPSAQTFLLQGAR